MKPFPPDTADMNSVRPAAVAGMFYPGSAAELRRDVAAMLASAATQARGRPVPKAIIAPHAGYVYSGPIAASVYARLAPARGTIERVVLLGPVHRVPVRGLALPDARALATPLGEIAVDAAAVAKIAKLPQVCVSGPAHAMEHSLEVHLPFLQEVLGDFTVVPLAVGDATADEVAQVLDALWGGDETLIVISSDLSHYLGYSDAQATDRATAQAILDLKTNISHEQACGGTPVNGLLRTARGRRLKPELIDLRNSGDTAGDRRRVVGYGAFAFYEQGNEREMTEDEARKALYGETRRELPADAGGSRGGTGRIACGRRRACATSGRRTSDGGLLAPFLDGITRQVHRRVPEVRRQAGLVFQMAHEDVRVAELFPHLRQKRAAVITVLKDDSVDAGAQLRERVRFVAIIQPLRRREHRDLDADAIELFTRQGLEAWIAHRCSHRTCFYVRTERAMRFERANAAAQLAVFRQRDERCAGRFEPCRGCSELRGQTQFGRDRGACERD